MDGSLGLSEDFKTYHYRCEFVHYRTEGVYYLRKASSEICLQPNWAGVMVQQWSLTTRQLINEQLCLFIRIWTTKLRVRLDVRRDIPWDIAVACV